MTNNTEISEQIKREIKIKHIPEQYQEIYAMLRAKNEKLNPLTKEMREGLIALALDTPDFIAEKVGEALEKKLTPEYIKEALSNERSRLADEKKFAERQMMNARIAQSNTTNVKLDYINQKSKLDEREAQLNQREKELHEFEQKVMQLESVEMRDRLRMYTMFKQDFEDNIQSAQNNTAFIAAAGTLLAGVPVGINGMANAMNVVKEQPPEPKETYRKRI